MVLVWLASPRLNCSEVFKAPLTQPLPFVVVAMVSAVSQWQVMVGHGLATLAAEYSASPSHPWCLISLSFGSRSDGPLFRQHNPFSPLSSILSPVLPSFYFTSMTLISPLQRLYRCLT
jgi:hypothetical protein